MDIQRLSSFKSNNMPSLNCHLIIALNDFLGVKIVVDYHFPLSLGLFWMNSDIPLFNACKNGNKNLVEYLVERKTDINKENECSLTPLFIACYNESKNVVEFLVELGADINKEDKDGVSYFEYNQDMLNVIDNHYHRASMVNPSKLLTIIAIIHDLVRVVGFLIELSQNFVQTQDLDITDDDDDDNNLHLRPSKYFFNCWNPENFKYVLFNGWGNSINKKIYRYFFNHKTIILNLDEERDQVVIVVHEDYLAKKKEKKRGVCYSNTCTGQGSLYPNIKDVLEQSIGSITGNWGMNHKYIRTRGKGKLSKFINIAQYLKVEFVDNFGQIREDDPRVEDSDWCGIDEINRNRKNSRIPYNLHMWECCKGDEQIKPFYSLQDSRTMTSIFGIGTMWTLNSEDC
ncbi:hypothetical protein H8356DRAFT_1429280 [Neocallimastix lanati (nom. inval.)]|nr:hypothetical protein H8356DRAFT_1429280 [Neocallimastix sp. JGI-2020a]